MSLARRRRSRYEAPRFSPAYNSNRPADASCNCGARHLILVGPEPRRAAPVAMLYADRAERYLRQRGIPYSPYNLSIHLLTPAQRRRALKKEAHLLRERGWIS